MRSAKFVGIRTTITTSFRNTAVDCVVRLYTKIVMRRHTSSRRVLNVISASFYQKKHQNVFYVASRMEF